MTVGELEELVIKAASIYYFGEYKGIKYDHPILSDAKFDEYIGWLRVMRPNSRALQVTGWGADPNKASGKKVQHTHGGMDSIDRKPRDINDVPANLRRNVRLSAKLDGLSAVMHFENGKLVYGATRGNGIAGLDKTEKFQALLERYGGTQLPDNFDGEVRGELVISKINWDKMVEAGTTKKHWRNAASGLINSNEITDEFKYVDFVPYKVIWDKNKVFSDKVVSSIDACEFCWFFPGFPLIPSRFYTEEITLNDLKDAYNAFSLIYPIDGVVITANDIQVNEDGTRVYDECAFKFESLKKQTKIVSITWQPTKSQILAPVANLEPVEIDGSMIANVTLHNAKNVLTTGAVPGATIELMKSGEVIPAITQVVEPVEYSSQDVIPQTCPECGGPVEWRGVHIACSNPACGNIDKQNLKIWTQQIAPMDGMAETLLFQYYDRVGISSISDIYASSTMPPYIKNALKGEGAHSQLFVKVYDKLTDGPVAFVTALQALNIPRLGPVTAEKLAGSKAFQDFVKSAFTDNGQIVEAAFSATKPWYDVICAVVGEGNGAVISAQCSKFKALSYIWNRIIFPEEFAPKADLIPVCITGKLSMPRKDFEKLLKDNGYITKEDVTKNVKYLITNEPSGTSGKHKQADKLGTPKITEQEMLAMLK